MKTGTAKKRKRPKIPFNDLFENESPPVMLLESEAIAAVENEAAEEEKAIDDLLDGYDEAFDKLEY